MKVLDKVGTSLKTAARKTKDVTVKTTKAVIHAPVAVATATAVAVDRHQNIRAAKQEFKQELVERGAQVRAVREVAKARAEQQASA